MDAATARSALTSLATQMGCSEYGKRVQRPALLESYSGCGGGQVVAGESLARVLEMMSRLAADLEANNMLAASSSSASGASGVREGSYCGSSTKPAGVPAAPASPPADAARAAAQARSVSRGHKRRRARERLAVEGRSGRARIARLKALAAGEN